MFIIAIAIIGLINMLLWNALIPDLFHGPQINYLQAVGLSVLGRLLIGHGPRHRRNWKDKFRRHRHRHNHWKQQWGAHMANQFGGSDETDWWSQQRRDQWRKFKQMSPEERQRMKREWACDFRKKYSNPEDEPASSNPTNKPPGSE